MLTAGLSAGMRVRGIVAGNRLWSVFNQIKVIKLVANMKVYLVLTHRLIRMPLVGSVSHKFCCDSCCLFGLKKKKATAPLRLHFDA